MHQARSGVRIDVLWGNRVRAHAKIGMVQWQFYLS